MSGDVLNRLMNVAKPKLSCHQFRQLFAGCGVTSLELEGQLLDETTLQWAAALPCLSELTLIGADSTNLMSPTLATFSRLYGLHLRQGFFSVTAELWRQLEALSVLEELTLQTTLSKVIQWGYSAPPSGCQLIARLRKLSIMGFSSLTSTLCLQTLTGVPSRRLLEFCVDFTTIDDAAVVQLPGLVPHLTAFSGNYSDISPLALPIFLQLPQLTTLSLNYCRPFDRAAQVPAARVEVLLQLGRQLDSLSCLSLRHTTPAIQDLQLSLHKEGLKVPLTDFLWHVYEKDDKVFFRIRNLRSNHIVDKDWVALAPCGSTPTTYVTYVMVSSMQRHHTDPELDALWAHCYEGYLDTAHAEKDVELRYFENNCYSIQSIFALRANTE